MKRVLLALLRVAALLLVVCVVLVIYVSHDRTDAFFITDAALADPTYLHTLDKYWSDAGTQWAFDGKDQYVVSAHRLAAGSGTIYAFRRYSPGKLLVTDTQEYEKLTVWTASPPATDHRTIQLGNPAEALVIYAGGGSSWPRLACSGYVSNGVLSIEPRDQAYQLAVHGTLEPMRHIGKLDDTELCRPQPIGFIFIAEKIQLSQLNPWLGAPGGDKFAETFRR